MGGKGGGRMRLRNKPGTDMSGMQRCDASGTMRRETNREQKMRGSLGKGGRMRSEPTGAETKDRDIKTGDAIVVCFATATLHS